ncbi:hypothetical protein T265_09101 [Opisthorchis viverrini]|uniref:Vacuole membrane protein 1 n=1 Tax=Opisthorchis viverrini TaxID=6198 RepID=A0A074ZHX8_OPIVI|nr:hypothetical protein T265_09101 [Opisthorchis viverrini]KER22895.1 hypothetical protein T265_09101 [Opisthorchis viverrini]
MDPTLKYVSLSSNYLLGLSTPTENHTVVGVVGMVRFSFLLWIWYGASYICAVPCKTRRLFLTRFQGPFIAEVTMSAYECKTLKFPRPPYPDRIICPEGAFLEERITFWRIMRKVQMESIMWGIGTAIGELPPYFMARGARLSDRHNDEDLKELEEILATEQTSDSVHTKDLSFQKRAELLLHRLIIRAGFVGILLCASVPNPLFDLAGMTCGHFLVPFWSFFGATVIGKAIIKVHLQQFTVIALSSEHHVESLVHLMGRIPVYGRSLQAPFLEYLQQQKANLHNKVTTTHQSWLQTIIFLIVSGLICSFVVSIIHALANKYQRRLRQWQRLAEAENLNSK